jgi:uncharacterized delta-60 repeat protein
MRKIGYLVLAQMLVLAWGVGAGVPSAPAAIVLDPTFGGDGIVTTPVGSSPGDQDIGTAMARQSDGKIVLAGGLNEDVFALVRYNADGTLDTGFGSGGKVTTDLTPPSPFEPGTDQVEAVAIQPDGKILAAGFAGATPNSEGLGGEFALVRYNADGSLDTGFGSGGEVITQVGLFGGPAFAMALQSDDKIVLAGRAEGSDFDSALVRYNTDGTLDTTFGDEGILITDLSGASRNDAVNSLAIQPDGKILAGGYSNSEDNDFSGDFALARYEADGSPDTGFGSGGKVITPVSSNPSPFFDDQVNALLLQPDGKILAGGYADVTGVSVYNHFALVRYNAAGTLDTGFGSGGKVITGVGPLSSVVYGLGRQSDGRIVAAGRSAECGTEYCHLNFASARYRGDGTLDPNYGGNGTVITPVAPDEQVDAGRALVIQPDGKIVIAGYADMGPAEYIDYDFALVRYLEVPDPPTLTDTSPPSPANDNEPKVRGAIGGGEPVQVKVYENATCSGSPAAVGGVAAFTGAGIAISVADNTTMALSAKASDETAKESPCSNSISYTEDSTPPETTIDSGPAGLTSDRTPSFAFSSSEDGSSFACGLDGAGLGPCSGPGASHRTSPLGDGRHELSLSATDRAGNTDPTPALRAFTIDATAPQTTIEKHPKKRTASHNATFAFGSSERSFRFECRRDGKPFKPCSSPRTFHHLKPGNHRFGVWAEDRAGNRDSTPATFRWKVIG